MKHIYYFIGIFVLLTEWGWIVAPREKTKEVQEFKEQHQQYKKIKWERLPEDYKDLLKKQFVSLVVFLWLVVGLFTFQWAGFLAILLFNLVVIAPISRLTRYSYAYTTLHWFNSVIGLAFVLFVIINAYHLKIDLWPYLKALFQ